MSIQLKNVNLKFNNFKKIPFFVCFLFLFLVSSAKIDASATTPTRTETIYDPIMVAAVTRKDAPVYNEDLSTRMTISNQAVKIVKGTSVIVGDEIQSNGKKWFSVSFISGEEGYIGYVKQGCVSLQPGDDGASARIIGVVNTKKVRASAEVKGALKSDGVKVTVKNDDEVAILSETYVGNAKWYKIRLTFNKNSVTGFLKPKFVQLTSPKHTETITALTSAEFEKEMDKYDMPDIYKPYLRTLHEKYPFWEFRTYPTGLKWSAALKAESKVGRNLITNSKSEAWKSKDPAAYDEDTGKWKIFDGSTWVAASEAAVAYYMDPRNFLNERTIYQFELQEYQPEYQTASCVDQIFSNTPFAGQRFTYTDPLTGKLAMMTYTSAYINAAKESGVSPIHLASRTKQEVVTSATSISGAVTGMNSTYPGIYNFYNIGATSGSNPLLNGLKWAATGDTYMRPWTDPYRSIVGGATYIGAGYISKGQNTVYLEKFNVTYVDRYSHQYMTNVEAAYSEALKIQKAYNESGLLESTPLVFCLPVYEDMPTEPCAAPV